jgi:TatA/E family protein of Tat protein translocase
MGIGSLGFGEMAIIFVIALIVFGPRKLPELGRSLGTAMREFRRSLNQIQRELEEADPVRTVRD